MNLSTKKSNLIFKAISCFFIIALLTNKILLFAQEEPPRGYSAEEFISLSRDITMDAALEIINLLSTKYEDKMILDPREHKAKIGVVVDNMHWKRALEYILRSNQLKYNERPRHYEIVELSEQKSAQDQENKINFATREIEIKAIFFEADQQALAEVGIDWSTIKNGKVKLQIGSNAAQNVGDNIFSVLGGWANDTYEITTIIKAFQSFNKGQVIATPQIRIMEGEEGKIKVGKNFFLTTRDFSGNTRYEQYESGTILTVLPKIISQGKFSFIHLAIQAEKSDVQPGAVNIVKKVTEGRTQVLLLNGEETAMAGLFSNEQTNVRKGVPVLKDLPWWFFGLRYLFGFNSQQIMKKELIILIKAEIVPNLVNRMKSKILEKNYLDERKREFDQKVKNFKK